MDKSQRINTIFKIARVLADEYDLLKVNIILKEYGIPCEPNPNFGDLENYVLESLSNAEDTALASLAQFLNISQLDIADLQQTTMWTEGCLRLFLSHTSDNNSVCQTLQEELQKFGVCTFVAHLSIEPNSDWEEVILASLRTCDACCALLTPNFHESAWTEQEVGIAFGRGIPVISVRAGRDPYGFMGRLQAVLTDKSEGKDWSLALSKKIFDVLRRDKRTYETLRHSVVHKFNHSGSFQETLDNLKLLAQFDEFTEQERESMVRAYKENRQIYHRNGIKDLLPPLVAPLTLPENESEQPKDDEVTIPGFVDLLF